MNVSSMLRAAVAAAAAVVALSGVANSEPQGGSSMIVGERTTQPIGHYEFCKANRTECNRRFATTVAPKLSARGWAQLERVNASVNARIVPKTDKSVYGLEEVWAYPTKEGDCEDFALLKRKELAEKCFSLADLLITGVRKPDGEGHAVLTVRTADGDFVLDNLDTKVRRWDETAYIYVKRQSSADTGRWLSIETARDMPVGSVE